MEIDPRSRSGMIVTVVLTVVLVAASAAIGARLLNHCRIALPSILTGDRAVVLFDFCVARRELSPAMMDRLIRDTQRSIYTARDLCPEPEALPLDRSRDDPIEEIDRRRAREGGVISTFNVTLVWNSDADLDLYVRCPGGDVLALGNSSDACGGAHQIDMNHGDHMSDQPVEDVVFDGNIEEGTYTIGLKRFKERTDVDGPTPYRIDVIVDGTSTVASFSGELTSNERVSVGTFEYPFTEDGE